MNQALLDKFIFVFCDNRHQAVFDNNKPHAMKLTI